MSLTKTLVSSSQRWYIITELGCAFLFFILGFLSVLLQNDRSELKGHEVLEIE